MINNLIFPENKNYRYYKIHYQFILDLFRYCNWNIEFDNTSLFNKTVFQINVDEKPVLIDFADNGDGINKSEIPIFKFHYKEDHKELKNVYPFSPVSFYEWGQYNILEKQIKYTCNNSIVLNNQRAYYGALKRRRYVKTLLSVHSMFHSDFEITDQLTFWQKINNCLVSVCVPGQNNNMLDRGQLQQMAFGCCTISPELPEILPVTMLKIMYPPIKTYSFQLKPMLHYIKCADDYSDLIEKIIWCRDNRQACIDIGNAAKKVFQKCLMPQSLINWIMECINE